MFDRIDKRLWWDKALTLVEGCTRCSPGCAHCWLKAMEKRFKGGEAAAVTVREDRLTLPGKRKKPAAWAVWSDLFHMDVTDAFIEKAFHYFAAYGRHVYLPLTKRSARAKRSWPAWYTLGNVWPGVTVCNQDEVYKVYDLIEIKAPVLFLSIEPLLGPLELPEEFLRLGKRAWVIVGGENGPGARPMERRWAEDLCAQCANPGVPFFFKGWGSASKENDPRLLGKEWKEVPEWQMA